MVGSFVEELAEVEGPVSEHPRSWAPECVEDCVKESKRHFLGRYLGRFRSQRSFFEVRYLNCEKSAEEEEEVDNDSEKYEPAVILSFLILARLALFRAFSRCRCSRRLVLVQRSQTLAPWPEGGLQNHEYLFKLSKTNKNIVPDDLDLKPRTSRQKRFDGLRVFEGFT